MKSVISKTLTAWTVCLALGIGVAGAANPVSVAGARKALRDVPAPEMPAKAAQMIAQVDDANRDAAAATIMTAAINVRPASAPAVVGAIARQVPAAAAPAAVKAASLQPKKLADIVTAAVSAAPGQTAQVVGALCTALPAKYATIATAAAAAAPAARQEILAAVTGAVPTLKPFVERALTDYAGRNPSIAALMQWTGSLVAETARQGGTTPEKLIAAPATPTLVVLAPPTVGPPYEPLPDGETPTEFTRSSTQPVGPGGGRDYSTP
jgi:hypothetical protein